MGTLRRKPRISVLDSGMYPDGILLRRWRNGDAAIPGFLDDYAFFVQGLLDPLRNTSSS